MTWGKMDDKFHRNKKVRELRKKKRGREALGLWVFWWSWCLDDPELTGEVPDSELDGVESILALMLVEVGLWERTDSGFRYHDFHSYNPTKQQVADKRAADRERIANKRNASREEIASESRATFSRVASPGRVPSRPNPEERERASGDAAAGAATTSAPEPKKPSKRNAELAALKETADRLAELYGHEVAPTASRAHWAEGLKKAQRLAPKRSGFGEAAEDVIRAAYERLDAGKSTSFGYALQDCTPMPSRGAETPATNGAAHDW